MKRCIFMLVLILGFQSTMIAQKSKSKQTSPKEDIKVNREFDENGNLIKFDSLYSYSWSGDTLLLDSLNFGNFPDLFGNKFNFPSDSIFPELPFFQGFNQDFFSPFDMKQDSMIKKFHGNHHFPFENDSIHSGFAGIEEFFKQFSENKNDSIPNNSPLNNQFYFDSRSMNEMMEMMQQQMKAMEEQHRKYFSK